MNQDALRELSALNACFIRNFVTNDVLAHDAILHRRFVCLMPDGRRLEREAYLAYWATAFDPEEFAYWDYRNESISLFANVALVRATTKHVRHAKGGERIGMTTYTDTYLAEGGAWRCIQAQLTPVTAEHYPGDDTIIQAWVHGRPAAA